MLAVPVPSMLKSADLGWYPPRPCVFWMKHSAALQGGPAGLEVCGWDFCWAELMQTSNKVDRAITMMVLMRRMARLLSCDRIYAHRGIGAGAHPGFFCLG